MTAGIVQLHVPTIGHSNHPVARFLEMLESNGVSEIADVRSVPYSRRYPDFNREPLRAALTRRGIDYLFLGAELGPRPADRGCYVNGRVQFGRLAATAMFGHGLDTVLNEAAATRLALLCADGQIEPHSQAMERLLDELRLRQLDLFGDPHELIEKAYAKQEERVAFAPSEGMTGADDDVSGGR